VEEHPIRHIQILLDLEHMHILTKRNLIINMVSYHSDSDINSAPSYSMSGRFTHNVETIVPGPGAYSSPTNGRKAPAYSISGRTPLKSESFSPGPGAYEPMDKRPKTAPAYTLSGRTELKASVDTPGLNIQFVF
jgi:hypothetical protein